MSSQYRVVEANKIEDFIAKNSRFIKICYQLQSGPFWGKTEALYDSAITFTRRTVGCTTLERGRSPKHLRTFTFHTSSDKFIRNGVPFTDGDISVNCSGDAFISFLTHHCHYFSLAVSDAFARKHLSDKNWAAYQQINSNERTVVVKNSAEHTTITELLGETLNKLANHTLLETDESVVEDIQHNLMEKLASMVKHADVERTRSNAANRLLDRASEIIMNNRYRNITVEELAKEVGTSRRNLELIFRANLSLSPKQFILSVRLNRIRQELLTKRQANVNGIVKRFGIKHLGHFSKAYKGLFLELPSETRERAMLPDHSKEQLVM